MVGGCPESPLSVWERVGEGRPLFGAGLPIPPTDRPNMLLDNRLREKWHGQETVPQQV
jgi:hypothetical protein